MESDAGAGVEPSSHPPEENGESQSTDEEKDPQNKVPVREPVAPPSPKAPASAPGKPKPRYRLRFTMAGAYRKPSNFQVSYSCF